MGSSDKLDWQRISDDFMAALALEPSARRRLVEELAGKDPDSAAELRRLLAAHDSEGVLDHSSALQLEARQMHNPSVLAEGTVLGGRFEILRSIAEGGIGHVYEALDQVLGSHVALKTLRPDLARDATARERFRREVLLARQVTHHNACRLFDAGQDGDVVFLTMELLDGETLAAKLEREGPLGRTETLAIAAQVAAALQYAHGAGIVHRDLKSGNVMLMGPEGAGRAVVTDFGLAKAAGEQAAASVLAAGEEDVHLTRAGQLVGTPAIMAPEQLAGGRITPATDVWAFGMLLHEMRTGRLPTRNGGEEGTGSPRVSPQLEPSWRVAISHCLSVDPARRPKGPGDVLESLEGGVLPEERARRRFGFALGATAAVLLVALGSAIFAALGGDKSSRASEVVDASVAAAEVPFVLVADFVNRTGEETFDGLVEAVLARELSNSRELRIAPRPRVDDALRLMQRPVESSLDREVAREIAARDDAIRSFLTGAVDKVGARYLVSVEVVAPETGETRASLASSADGTDEVLPALARLARELRRSLGESIRDLEPPPGRYARVTTSSLRAFQLYTKADQMMMRGGNRSIPAQLLRDAIREDPGFASAYTHLAWCTPDRDEKLELSRRALDLAGAASAAERHFIEGSDHYFRGDRERAVLSHEAILEHDPDHWWALNNLLYIGGPGPWRRRSAEMGERVNRLLALQPESVNANYLATIDAIWEDRLDEAAGLAERTLDLTNRSSGTDSTYYFMQVYLPHHVDWLRGDVDAVLHRLESESTLTTVETVGQRLSLQARVNWHFILGRPREALEILELAGIPELFRYWAALDAGDRGDVAALLAGFKRSFADFGDEMRMADGLRAERLARAGRPELARAAVDELVARGLQNYARVGEGAIALARDEVRGAIEALQPLERGEWPLSPGNAQMEADAVFHAGIVTLAEALRRDGQLERAVELLTARREARAGTHHWGRVGWMRGQVALARLYRQLGEESRARAIEEEIRDLLRLAEPDFHLLRDLDDRAAETLLIPSIGG